MKKLALILAMTALPAHAGGPVLMIEDTTETVTPDRDNGWIVPVLALLAIGIIASGGGDGVAVDVPTDPKPCVKISGDGC